MIPEVAFTICVVPQKIQRYKTVGDWYDTAVETVVVATELPDPDMTFLIAVHELVECYLCQRAGVTQEQVDQFDMNYNSFLEPGDDDKSPYRLQHQSAESIERHLAQVLGVDWNLYQKEIDKVLEGK